MKSKASPLPEAHNIGGHGLSDYTRENIVLRLEYMSDAAARTVVIVFRIVLFICTAALALIAAWKFESTSFTKVNKLIILNTSVSMACTVVIVVFCCFFAKMVYAAVRSHKRWNARRKRLCILCSVDLTLGLLYVVFSLYPNAYVLWSQPCGWFLLPTRVGNILRGTFMTALICNQLLHGMMLPPLEWFRRMGTLWKRRWSSLKSSIASCCTKITVNASDSTNNSNKDADAEDNGLIQMGIDLHWYYYLGMFIFAWSPYAVMIIVNRTTYIDNAPGGNCQSIYDTTCFPFAQEGVPCQEWNWECDVAETSKVLAFASTAWAIFIALVYFLMMYIARKELQRLPYNKYRVANIAMGLQIPTRAAAIGFYLISAALLWFVNVNSCNSVIVLQMGLAPVLVCLTCLAVLSAYQMSPIAPGDEELKLHAWLQDFAWTEKDIPRKLAARPFTGEPCFCFETALKCHYLSMLIYDIDEVEGTEYTLETAKGLYGLNDHRIFWHKKHDVKCLVCWSKSNGTVTLSFRGTASLANVMADLKVWRVSHPPVNGNYFLRTRAMVHTGFLQSWQESGLQAEVLNLLQEIFKDNPTDHDRPWRVILTGHSLGGAMAQLAAYDIATIASQYSPLKKLDITCVTYGCPRPGNHAFAKRFIAAVPDSWDIIHTNDIIARSGKFIFLYKRAAYQVIVSLKGDLIVRPSYAEHSVQRGAAQSIKNHLLSVYSQSLMAIIENQYSSKALDGGRGAVRLFSMDGNIRRVVQSWALEGQIALFKLANTRTLRRMASIIHHDEDQDINISHGLKMRSLVLSRKHTDELEVNHSDDIENNNNNA